MGLHVRDQVGRSIGADPKWVQRGLKSLYRLAPGVWHVNQVTGEVGGTVAGSGFTFKDGRLKTPGTASNGAILWHGLSVPLASTAFTLLVGVRSATGVSWSLMSEGGTTGTWTGWYGGVAGSIGSTNNNSFDGALSLTTDEVSAFGFGGANNLRGAGRTGTAIDATAQAPGTGSATTVALGWARHNNYNDNPGAAEFSFFAAFQGLLSYAEMQALVNDPEQLFRASARRIWVPVSAGGGGGTTISVPAGSLALTGFAPTVSATDNQIIAVPAGALTLAGFAPTVNVGANQSISVPAGSLTMTGFAPTVNVGVNQNIAVPAGSLILTGFAPTISTSANQTIAVPVGSLTLTGFAPTVVQTAHQTISVPLGTLVMAGYAPTVSASGSYTISVPLGALVLTGYAPVVNNSGASATVTVKLGSWIRYKILT